MAQNLGLSSYCGLGTNYPNNKLSEPNKIVGGTQAQKGNWGWQVRTQLLNNRFLIYLFLTIDRIEI